MAENESRGPVDQQRNPATISVNKFKFKSLSNWSYNISEGCKHGCSFCYVPSTSTIKAEERIEKAGFIPSDWIEERKAGLHWADHYWGEYVLLRSWDEKKFKASLAAAEKLKKENKCAPDSNQAIMLCTTTDPYQTLSVPGNPDKTKLLNDLRGSLVRRALELILDESTLNVRILTRSPLAKKDFDLFKKFGDRLMFGMSIPTLDDDLSRIYEPKAPGPAIKLQTLQEAKEAGLHVYVALAPTVPDEGRVEITKTMRAIAELKPLTVFHEPINLRADNVARIEKKAKELGRYINSEVFQSKSRWREYAFERFLLVDEIAEELNYPEGVLHQWPDEDLATESQFLRMKQMQLEREFPGTQPSRGQRVEFKEQWNEFVSPWLKYWHNPEERISAWPGVRTPTWK